MAVLQAQATCLPDSRDELVRDALLVLGVLRAVDEVVFVLALLKHGE